MFDRPRRRSIRLPQEAYCRPGAFFVTICLRDRHRHFGACLAGIVMLSPIGDICRGELLAIPDRWPSIDLDAWVVMPDHLHCILLLHDHLPEGLPQVIGGFKSGVSRIVGARYPGLPGPLWQRGFYDRLLCTPAGLDRARRYIAENPTRWG